MKRIKFIVEVSFDDGISITDDKEIKNISDSIGISLINSLDIYEVNCVEVKPEFSDDVSLFKL
jgi:hypothetical protein